MKSESKRPLGITILMIWFVMEGIYYFYTNSIGMFGGQNLSSLFGGTLLENSFAVYGFGLALFYFVMAWSFMQRKHWARVTAIIFFLITTGISGILMFLRYVTIFEIIIIAPITVIVVIYLMKSNVKEYFGQTSLSYSSSPI